MQPDMEQWIRGGEEGTLYIFILISIYFSFFFRIYYGGGGGGGGMKIFVDIFKRSFRTC